MLVEFHSLPSSDAHEHMYTHTHVPWTEARVQVGVHPTLCVSDIEPRAHDRDAPPTPVSHTHTYTPMSSSYSTGAIILGIVSGVSGEGCRGGWEYGSSEAEGTRHDRHDNCKLQGRHHDYKARGRQHDCNTQASHHLQPVPAAHQLSGPSSDVGGGANCLAQEHIAGECQEDIAPELRLYDTRHYATNCAASAREGVWAVANAAVGVVGSGSGSVGTANQGGEGSAREHGGKRPVEAQATLVTCHDTCYTVNAVAVPLDMYP